MTDLLERWAVVGDGTNESRRLIPVKDDGRDPVELHDALLKAAPKAKMLDLLIKPENIDGFLEATRTIVEHPDGYDDACMCQLCCSYGD
jgi:hypothetical protein